MQELFKFTGQTAIGLMVTFPLLLERENKKDVNYILFGGATFIAGQLVCWLVDNRRKIMRFLREDAF